MLLQLQKLPILLPAENYGPLKFHQEIENSCSDQLCCTNYAVQALCFKEVYGVYLLGDGLNPLLWVRIKRRRRRRDNA
jgi:hypothetical protein